MQSAGFIAQDCSETSRGRSRTPRAVRGDADETDQPAVVKVILRHRRAADHERRAREHEHPRVGPVAAHELDALARRRRVPGFEVAGLRGAADRRREDADVDADRSR
jgi:hypothetical protein